MHVYFISLIFKRFRKIANVSKQQKEGIDKDTVSRNILKHKKNYLKCKTLPFSESTDIFSCVCAHLHVFTLTL